jgi:hypothetical protein
VVVAHQTPRPPASALIAVAGAVAVLLALATLLWLRVRAPIRAALAPFFSQ